MSGLPLIVYPGNYTPGAETALHAAVDVINATWEQANLKMAALEAKVDEITDPVTGWLASATAPHISAGTAVIPSIVEPLVTIPTSIDTSTILGEWNVEYDKLRTKMVSDLSVIFANYFPNDTAMYAAAETWVQGAIANPNGGLPIAVQNQIEADDHARVTATANRELDSVTQNLASLRFPAPPGALLSAQLQIAQKGQEGMAEGSRKITMASVEMMKFAIEKALDMRKVAIGSALDYVKTLASAPDIASKVIGIGYDAQARLISAVSAYYNARSEAQKVMSGVDEFNVTTQLQAAKENQAADLKLIEDRLRALLEELRVFGQTAASLFNNLHASAGTSYGVNIT